MNTIENAIDEFLLACRADGLSAATTKWYGSMLRQLVKRYPGKAVEQISTNMMREYMVDLRSRDYRYSSGSARPQLQGGLSAESIRAHIRALRRFFAWSYAEYEISAGANPMSKIRMPPRQRHEPKAIDLADLKLLLGACGDDPKGLRDRAILMFLTDTGCRAGGLLTLTRPNLNIVMLRALVCEKGDKQRVVPFTAITAETLQNWLAVAPQSSEMVFCSMGRFNGSKMTNSGLNQLLERLAKKAGVTGRVNPHSFRHGFAREWLMSGGNLGVLSEIMGHSTVNTTMSFYARFNAPELAKFHQQHSPIHQLEK